MDPELASHLGDCAVAFQDHTDGLVLELLGEPSLVTLRHSLFVRIVSTIMGCLSGTLVAPHSGNYCGPISSAFTAE